MAHAARPPLWTPPFVMLSLANFCSTMVFYLLMPTMATHASAAFGAGPAEAGLVSSVFLIGALFGRPLAGFLLGVQGLRRVLVWATAAYALAGAGYFVAPSLVATLAVRTAHGVAFGVAASAILGAVMSVVPVARQGEGAGWSGAGVAIGTGVGPFLGFQLLNSPAGMTAVFAAVAGFASAALVLVVVAARSLPRAAPAATHRRPAIIERHALPIGLVVACTAVAFGSILTFLNTFTRDTQLAPAASGYFVVYAAAVLVTRPPAGIVQDRHGDDVVLVPALVLLVAGVSVTALAGHGFVLLVGAALLGAGYGTLISAGQAFAIGRVPRGQAGVAVASFFLVVDAGTGLGPALLGLLAPAIGFRGVFLVGAALGVVALGLYLLVARRTPRASALTP